MNSIHAAVCVHVHDVLWVRFGASRTRPLCVVAVADQVGLANVAHDSYLSFCLEAHFLGLGAERERALVAHYAEWSGPERVQHSTFLTMRCLAMLLGVL